MPVRIVGIGGTVHSDSTTEQAMLYALRPASAAGAEIQVFGGKYLAALPHYLGAAHNKELGQELVGAVRDADGLVIAAPGYHGTVSGMVKNALDYLEDLARDTRPYLDGRAVGLLATAYGDQAAMGTLQTLRGIVHALRGWPTPMGGTIRTYHGLFDEEGECVDERIAGQLLMVGEQVLMGARSFATQKD